MLTLPSLLPLACLASLVPSPAWCRYSASEPSWLGRVFAKREAELRAMLRTRLNEVVLEAIWTGLADWTMLVALASVSLTGKREFDVSTLFTSVALFQLIEQPM